MNEMNVEIITSTQSNIDVIVFLIISATLTLSNSVSNCNINAILLLIQVTDRLVVHVHTTGVANDRHVQAICDRHLSQLLSKDNPASNQ